MPEMCSAGVAPAILFDAFSVGSDPPSPKDLQNILRPERDNGRDYQGKEHQDQHEWIDHSIAPRMQEVYIAAQVFRNFFRRVDFRRRLQLRRGRLVSLLAAL